MISLSQEAVKELFDRVAQRYFAGAISEDATPSERIIYKKNLDKFAREFIQIQRNLSDEYIEKFFCLYFIGTIRFNQEKYNAAYKWLTEAKKVSPDASYIFMDMYAACLFIRLSQQNRYGDGMNAAFNCFFQGIAAAKSKCDEEAYQRLKQKYEEFFNQAWNY
jgi:hypothetical protein